MNKFMRYYNRNHRELIIIAIIIIFVVILLQLIEYSIANRKQQERDFKKAVEGENNSINEIYRESVNTQSIITGKKNIVTASRDVDTILQFIQYCNDEKIEDAYNMLTNECKEEMFPKLENFKNNYYNNNFETEKKYNIQNWIDSIYKVNLKEDGKNTNIQDYITVVNDGRENKLNINNYIGRSLLSAKNELYNVNIKVIEQDIYMQYEYYTFEVINNNEFDIFLDNLENTNTIYVIDENDMKHIAYLHELSKEQLYVRANSGIKIKIKFTGAYISDRRMEQILFTKVILCDEEEKIKEIFVDL